MKRVHIEDLDDAAKRLSEATGFAWRVICDRPREYILGVHPRVFWPKGCEEVGSYYRVAASAPSKPRLLAKIEELINEAGPR